jgi:hypothetical protein
VDLSEAHEQTQRSSFRWQRRQPDRRLGGFGLAFLASRATDDTGLLLSSASSVQDSSVPVCGQDSRLCASENRHESSLSFGPRNPDVKARVTESCIPSSLCSLSSVSCPIQYRLDRPLLALLEQELPLEMQLLRLLPVALRLLHQQVTPSIPRGCLPVHS